MRSILLLSLLLISLCSYAQGSKDDKADKPDYGITIGLNARKPVDGLSLSDVFPLVRRNKNSPVKTMIGGFNVGVSRYFTLQKDVDLKAQVNFSRQVYWELPVQFNKGPSAVDMLGVSSLPSVEYYVSALGIVHKRFGYFFPGIGLGFEGLIASTKKFSTYGGVQGNADLKDIPNREFKRIMPVIPFELSFKHERMIFNWRYETGLLNRFRGDLADGFKNRYGVLCFEMGMRIN